MTPISGAEALRALASTNGWKPILACAFSGSGGGDN
jgi:hypothetical protein